jgi:hypothetical protein
VAGAVSFAPKLDFPVGANPNFVALADVNMDGKLDLAVTNSESNTVSILLGNGDGTFQSYLELPSGSQPQSVAVADLNGDTRPDLVVANHLDRTLSLFLADGTGGFSRGSDLNTAAVGNGPRVVAVGDFNRDGLLDLAVASDNVENPGVVSVFLGSGGGGFGPRNDFVTGKSSRGLTVGDLDGDGVLDIVTADLGGSAGAGTVSVLLGTGTAGFSQPISYPTGGSSLIVAVADFDGNATLDLAVANSSSNDVSILLGDGTGLFAAATNFAAGSAPGSVASGDLCWGYALLHPDALGYRDPLRYVHGTNVLETARTGIVVDVVRPRIGPGGLNGFAYRRVDEMPPGTYELMGSSSGTEVPDCPEGWYQLRRSASDCSNEASCFANVSFAIGSSIPDAWVCSRFVLAAPHR